MLLGCSLARKDGTDDIIILTSRYVIKNMNNALEYYFPFDFSNGTPQTQYRGIIRKVDVDWRLISSLFEP